MNWLNVPMVAAPLGWLARCRVLPGVAVLCYHGVLMDDSPPRAMPFEGLHVRASVFAAHCDAIARYCHPISLDRWRNAIRGEARLPPRPVVITFDDGYRSVRTCALPALERTSIPAAVFVTTRAIAAGELFWYDAVASAKGDAAVESMKALPYAEWRRATEECDRAVSRDDPRAPLDTDEVGQLAAHPLIEIGGHTASHPILMRAPVDVQAAEINDCGHAIRAWTGRAMQSFAYPNGRPGIDFSDETRRLVAAAGVDLAFTTAPGLATPHTDSLMQPRFTITNGVTVAHLLNRLARSWI